MADQKVFTLAEIAQKTTKKDIHLLINGKVYAVAKFLDEHPGGDEVLLQEAGKDATDAFEDVGHSDEARDILKTYQVGICTEAPAKAPAKSKTSSKIATQGQGYVRTLCFQVDLQGRSYLETARYLT